MTEEARSDWLRVAWMTVSHLPSDLLERGCKKARETADHPSKIVPIILKEVESDMEWRRRMAPSQSSGSLVTALPEPKPDYCTAEEASKILQEVGLRAKWKGQSDE